MRSAGSRDASARRPPGSTRAMAQRPSNPLYRLPAGVVVGIAVALAVVLAIAVAAVGCEDEDGAGSAPPPPEAATTTVAAPQERCIVVHARTSVVAAFAGTEANVACAQFAIQAPEYGGAPWRVEENEPAPPLTPGRRVVCRLHAPNAAHVVIQDARGSPAGAVQCARMRRDGWEQDA
jgi:hypothetical protein